VKKNLMLGFFFLALVATLRAEDQKAAGMLDIAFGLVVFSWPFIVLRS